MPTETFFHLPKEKQKRILEAAKIEFSRVPLKEAAIANIIKAAEIPRGSFYQYFDNKEDLYFYYFQTLQKNSHRDLIRFVEEKQGDLFAGFENYFSQMIVEVLTGKHAKFYRNLFMNMDYRSFHRVAPEVEKKVPSFHSHKEKLKNHQALINVVDQSMLEVADDLELKKLIHMLMHIVFSTVTEAYRNLLENPSYDSAQAVNDFSKKIGWLRDGAKKKEGK